MVIPEMGFDDVPMRPVMRDETVTKKKPKMTMSSAARKLPCVGMRGATARKIASSSDPTEHDDQRDVPLGAELCAAPPRPALKSFMLSRNDEMIVGIVRASVMRPDASTAPAPV